ncbi:MAG TPA: RtcB family protein [Candidatus Limnocylindrales bacterium]|nr:RtcB family protein [Candidatus Limnocylindrales bacterium]
MMQLERLDEVRWRLPRQGNMRVDGMIYADDLLMTHIQNDPCVQQVANVATLPGIVGRALAMPDIHWGYGFPIGGVAAFDPDQGGVVSPGGVGYDINCGVRLHATQLERGHVARDRDRIADALAHAVPAGVGVGKPDARVADLDAILADGARSLVGTDIVTPADLDSIEEGGRIPGAAPQWVSDRARERGHGQIGSLGSGNHFLELDVVAEVYDEEAAQRFGLQEGGVTLLVHSGSRGLGHQVCEDMLALMLRASQAAGIVLPDKQLACAPLYSDDARRYLGAMAAAANFAFANRSLIAHRALNALAAATARKKPDLKARLVYDVCHNIAKYEEHVIDGRPMRVCVHRKGATRAFGPGHPGVPANYRDVGQPVIIPGDMGRYSYVLCGQKGAMDETFGSACHGAGRLLARNQAKKLASGREVQKRMAGLGIALRAASMSAVSEEAPEAYKDVADVVGVVEKAGIARRVARLEPLVVVKG